MGHNVEKVEDMSCNIVEQLHNSNNVKSCEDLILKEIDNGLQTTNNDCDEHCEFIELQPLSSNEETSSNFSKTEQNNKEQTSHFKISPIFIPMLIVELILSLIDLLSDTWTGFSLLKLKDNAWAGVVSFVINWIPGVIGAIQIFANRRCENISTTIMYCLASLVLCPLVPSITFVYLLFKVPRNSKEEKSKEIMHHFHKILSFAKVVRALEGCIESPLQLLYKTFLMFNGIIDFNFTNPDLVFQDFHGNSIPFPFLINFVISSLTLIKSVYGLNTPYFKAEATSKFLAMFEKLDFVGFLVISTLFKLGSLILILGYFNYFGILPMILILLLGCCANFLSIRDHGHIPNWLLVFMNLFVPICFKTKDGEDISKAQAKNLRLQTWNCSTVYGLALIILGLLVSLSKLNMNQKIPINFEMFIILITTIFAFGILSVLFSFRLALYETMKTWKKILFIFAKIFRLISLLGLMITSITLLAITPPDSPTYVVIWKNKSSPMIFETLEVTPLKIPVINLPLDDLEIIEREEMEKKTIEVQNLKKVVIILDNQPFKPSSPKPWQSCFNISTIVIPQVQKKEFKEIINVYGEKYLIHISKTFESWNNQNLPVAKGK